MAPIDKNDEQVTKPMTPKRESRFKFRRKPSTFSNSKNINAADGATSINNAFPSILNTPAVTTSRANQLTDARRHQEISAFSKRFLWALDDKNEFYRYMDELKQSNDFLESAISLTTTSDQSQLATEPDKVSASETLSPLDHETFHTQELLNRLRQEFGVSNTFDHASFAIKLYYDITQTAKALGSYPEVITRSTSFAFVLQVHTAGDTSNSKLLLIDFSDHWQAPFSCELETLEEYRLQRKVQGEILSTIKLQPIPPDLQDDKLFVCLGSTTATLSKKFLKNVQDHAPPTLPIPPIPTTQQREGSFPPPRSQQEISALPNVHSFLPRRRRYSSPMPSERENIGLEHYFHPQPFIREPTDTDISYRSGSQNIMLERSDTESFVRSRSRPTVRERNDTGISFPSRSRSRIRTRSRSRVRTRSRSRFRSRFRSRSFSRPRLTIQRFPVVDRRRWHLSQEDFNLFQRPAIHHIYQDQKSAWLCLTTLAELLGDSTFQHTNHASAHLSLAALLASSYLNLGFDGRPCVFRPKDLRYYKPQNSGDTFVHKDLILSPYLYLDPAMQKRAKNTFQLGCAAGISITENTALNELGLLL